MERNQQIIILSAVLGAVIIVSGLLLWLLPGAPSADEEGALGRPSLDTTPTTTDFNVTVLQRSDYLELNAQLVIEGLLPVQPPTPVGKANPFL